MRLNKINNSFVSLVLTVVLALGIAMPAMSQNKAPKMTKQERVCLRNGNKLYEKKRYAEAEVEYRKALQANPASEKAQFNLATALMRQGSVTSQENDDKNPMKQAEGMLTNLAKGAQDKQLRGKASYDLGNIAYGRQQYDQAVEFYKHALRCNPDDEQARHNLRLAQLKSSNRIKIRIRTKIKTKTRIKIRIKTRIRTKTRTIKIKTKIRTRTSKTKIKINRIKTTKISNSSNSSKISKISNNSKAA